MIIGIDHGYYAIKTKNFSFPAGVTAYTHEPYTLKNTLQIGGKYFVCGTGRQPILRDKTVNDNYYILTLAAIAMELRCRGLPAESSVTLAAGLPLARYGRDKKPFTEYLLRNGQPVNFLFEGERYKVKIESVKLFPQGYSAIAIHPELVKDEPSVLLMDIGGWTVDLMRLDNNVPNAATCRSLELGMIRCMDEIQEQVRRDTGLSVTDAQVERILAGKPCSMDEEARKLIQRQGRLYTERLISAAMALPVILMGGGAATVMRNVSERDGLCRAFLIGDDILAAADGMVTIANGIDSWGGSYGYHIKIDHGNGLETLYAHCSAICVNSGQQVQQGEVIGFVGSTGNSTGNHLHFEAWMNGERKDAMKLI